MLTDKLLTSGSVRGRFAFVAVCVLAGLAFLAIGIGTGHVRSGLVEFAIMIAYAALVITVGRRSESAALLSGKVSDERQLQVVTRASAATGQLLVVVLVVGMLVSSAMDAAAAGTWAALCGAAGVAFIGFTIYFSRRG